MTSTDRFKSILKKKGIGKTMGKHMVSSDIDFVMSHLKDTSIPSAMKTTLLTAWLMLESTTEEASALQHLKLNFKSLLPQEFYFLFQENSTHDIDQLAHHVIQHQSLSKKQLHQILIDTVNQTIPDYKASVIFEGLRLKGETLEENLCVFNFFHAKTTHQTLNIPLLVDMATPYDGANRTYYLQPFVCALLASIGIKSVIHGVLDVSPKFGMTTHKLFQLSNKNPLKSMDEVAIDIINPEIGWGYIDQSIFCPKLHQLIPLRENIVKRPVFATIEKWLQPFSAAHNICITGFTHPPYKQKTIDIIHQSQLYQQLILVRGVEGSSLLPIDRRTPYITSTNSEAPNMSFLSPSDVGLTAIEIPDQVPNNSLQAGIDALSGKKADLTNFLIYQALAICRVLGRDINTTKSDIDDAIASGKALLHWQNSAN